MDGHTTSHSHSTPHVPVTGDGLSSLVVAKDGDNYYPTEPAYYIGGDIYTVIANPQETGGAFEFLDFYIPAKTVDVGVPQHTHANEAEAKYVLEGEVSFYFGGGTLTAPAGTFVYYAPGRPMGFQTTDQPARLAVLLTPGVGYYELAGVPVDVPVDVPPPQANIAELQQQVNFPRVIEVNNTYGGAFYNPQSPATPTGLLNTVLVVPDASLITDALRQVEGLTVFSLSERPTTVGDFGIQYTSLANLTETDGTLAYSQFSLAPQTEFPTSIVTEERKVFYVQEGMLSVKIGDEVKMATPDTFVYVSPGQSYSIANLEPTTTVKALTATIADTYVPKIGQYLPGNIDFTATVRNDAGDYIQGNVISTAPKAIGTGWIYTWGAFDSQDAPTSIGVTFTKDALGQSFIVDDNDPSDGLFPRRVNHLSMPETPDMPEGFAASRVFDVLFPSKVIDKTPFNHMGFYSNSEGHSPTGIYDLPHLDVHFFLGTIADRELITGMPEDNNDLYNLPAPGYLHPDYIAPTIPGTDILGTGDAKQGIHWVDRTTPELSGQRFGQTFIFGSYADQVNFWEPMITREFMEMLSDENKSEKLTFSIKQPSRFLEQGYYPLEYSISYNHDFQEYTVSLDKMTLRLADPQAAEAQAGVPAQVLDLRDRTGPITGSFSVSKEAAYSNSGGFYVIEDTNGTVRDPITGALIAPGQAGYAQAALRRRVLDLAQDGSTTMNMDGGMLLAPYLVANSTVEQFLAENPNNEAVAGRPIAYFAFAQANPDGLEHVRQMGLNTFAFEDLLGGGDNDFNDSVVSGGPSLPPPAPQTTQVATGAGTITGTALADTLYGSASGANTLTGLIGDDVLYAGTAGSTLQGGAGADLLVAAAGTDLLVGGEGFDQFIFQKPFATTVNGTAVTQGGYGGSDIILDFQTVAGSGDRIRLRNLDNGTGINVRDDNGNAIITIENRINIDPTGGPSGTGTYVPILLQTIRVQGVSAAQLMTQGLIDVNNITLNDGTEGLTRPFGTYDYQIGSQSATFPTRPGGVAGNTVFGFPGFSHLVSGDPTVNDAQIAALIKRIVDGVVNNPTGGLKIPGTDEVNISGLTQAQKDALLAERAVGIIPESLLPRGSFGFALDGAGNVDLSRFFRPGTSTVNDDLILGGPSNDVLIGGPGNDQIVGGAGQDIIWAGAGQDIVVGGAGLDYIIFDSILDIRDRDVLAPTSAADQSVAQADARTGYIRLEENYGTKLINGAGNPNPTDQVTTTGPDIIMINHRAFNRGINADSPMAATIGALQPGTFISGDGRAIKADGTLAPKGGQLNVGTGTVPNSNGPAADDLQPTFYYSPTAGRLFFDRDGSGDMFFDYWMTDMGVGIGTTDAFTRAGIVEQSQLNQLAPVPNVLIYVY